MKSWMIWKRTLFSSNLAAHPFILLAMFAYFNVDDFSVKVYSGVEEMFANVDAYCDYTDCKVSDYYKKHNFSEKDIFDCDYMLHRIFSHDNVLFCNGESKFVMDAIEFKRDNIDIPKASKIIKETFPNDKTRLYLVTDVIIKKPTLANSPSDSREEFTIELTYDELYLPKDEKASSILRKANREIIISELLKDL